jgi:hypothetical protein
MRHSLRALSCAVVASLALLAGCSGSGKTAKPADNTTPDQPKSGSTASSRELDKLMRTRMNVAYSQLVYLVFHSDNGPDYAAIAEEASKLTEAVGRVLALPAPPLVQSEQAHQVYVDYNNTLRRDNEKFGEAIARKDIGAMSAALSKMGDTCSACHHFFRVNIKDAAE